MFKQTPFIFSVNRKFSALFTLFSSLSALAILSGCNLYGGIDKPHGDAQLLSSARACLNRGDYDCASTYYQQLSDSYLDVRVSELSFNTLAQHQIFSISDLVSSLGSGRGGNQSFLILSQMMASRNKLDGATRTTIQDVYKSNNAILNPQLRAFMKFLSAVSMFSEVLANAVNTGGGITAADLVASPSTCSALTCLTAACNAPGTNTLGVSPGSDSAIDASFNGNWSTGASPTKLVYSAQAAAAEIATFAGAGSSYQGIVDQMNQLGNIAVAGDGCMRYGIANILFGL